MSNELNLRPIILGAVRTRTTLTVEHFLSSPITRQSTLNALASKEVAWELMNFGYWSWRRAVRVMISNPHDRLEILDSQRTYLVNHPKPNNNHPKEYLDSL